MPSSIDEVARAPKVVVALSGFLGRPGDWSLIKDLLPPGWRLHALDVLEPSPLTDFDAWATNFNQHIDLETKGATTRILLGYSMGGRLAMHALAHDSRAKESERVFDGSVIVSAHPGLSSDEERAFRVKADEAWAQRFASEPWLELMNAWNAQPALRGPLNPAPDSISLKRSEGDFNRGLLADCLRVWSLGKQRDLRSELSSAVVPIELVTGRDDGKFTVIAQDFVRQPSAGDRSISTIERAGHRVPWDAPTPFRALLAKFLSRW